MEKQSPYSLNSFAPEVYENDYQNTVSEIVFSFLKNSHLRNNSTFFLSPVYLFT